ncbi:MAG TPA: glycosyltransferase 87 family protein, partial [Candidatus Limnocylindrales bacterium]
VYHGAIHYWVHDGGELYDYFRPDSGYGFTYPPFAAVAMLPLAVFGWHPAIAANLVLSTAVAAGLLHFLVDPIARREGWSRWYTFGLAACLFAMLGPVRDTFSFGQINLLLVGLVYADLWLLSRCGTRRFAGVGIGLAAAVKLTPAIFIAYLLLTRRWRAAGVATGTAAGATLLAAAVAPDASRAYFTDLLWDTGRIGSLDYVSNQSLMGFVARLDPQHPSRLLWITLVAAVLAVWAWRVRGADERAGWALTGAAACLVSPITWVHHLVWLVPGLVVLADSVLPWKSRNPLRLWSGVAAYATLATGVVWLWSGPDPLPFGGIGVLGANAFVIVTLAMLARLPTQARI